MGNSRGFIDIKRDIVHYQPREQASRCMDCGTPFCHWACPLGNYIPEWNDLVYNQQWRRAYELLSAINPMPEVPARICPALCEYACVLDVNDDPVTIRENELAVIEYAFKHGLVRPKPPKKRTNNKVAVVGSGPAGLACAVELNKAGHKVTVFEQDDKIGGLLRYGIPDFKLDKKLLDRRIKIWQQEGIAFITNKNIIKPPADFDAVCLATGCCTARDLKVPGRKLSGINFALDYLVKEINTKGKKVVVIGGGDTGSDCVATANRRGASSVIQIEILPKPPTCRLADCPWPRFPKLLKEEKDCERHWSVKTKKLVNKNGKVTKIICEQNGKEFEIEADLLVLALGFIKQELGREWRDKKVFLAGDVRRGSSLIVWAIYEGRQAAQEIDKYLGGVK